MAGQKRYMVVGDILVPFGIEVVATSMDEAEAIVEGMHRTELLNHGATDNSSLGLKIDAVDVVE